MTDPSLIWSEEERPSLNDPILVVMMTGWIDAGAAAAAAMDTIMTESNARTVAVFDDDTYVDFRARRPMMQLRDGLNTVLDWNRITISTGCDQAGHDLVLLSGPEPDMAWHRFVATMSQVAVDLGVRRMVDLGAYPFATPHTRPSRLSVTTPSADVLAAVPFLRSSVDVPAGAAAALEHAMHERGIPALGIWAQVPHYVATAGYAAASVALLDALRDVTDVVIEGIELREQVGAQRRHLDEMVAGNDEHQRMLSQLEELHDSTSDTWEGADDRPGPGGLGGPGLEMRSGDELAAELERFLRDQE
jgi:proteasome assembly chaperone (PAC2) family protein